LVSEYFRSDLASPAKWLPMLLQQESRGTLLNSAAVPTPGNNNLTELNNDH